ncbi:transporter substrate-binding domain-containing protein [Streptomyces olivaceus]|uniref:Transporter substrate-binding domain-containing protein n=1 Tax=Streptomyces olivaceus TaxID=47716 RepID=A0ABS7WB26_STROV|nr:transporter substrate-binding domain-containing protein [Streptomyces olivaceus]MBZ6091905.1 transporter substrate-binding domain-containing protein [Streptomyces olivaceus]MBZ6098921.1 transporter substrate-binding domain-containing protein [Streptomyces olivaceus]MBZ6118973.1 transporter substrate-binding domain-containing protein [Streptomyces olivaceus]MBZ6154406.1 transporter substrate-binding domain-containing protein [Streptomyces olivaceus]MBZ6300296.1 transporter substrate-binding 
MPTHFTRRSLIRGITAATAVATLATGLAACGGDSDAAATTSDSAGTVTVGRLSNGAAKEAPLKVAEVKSVSAELPDAIKKSGKLVIGSGTMPSGSPPLGFVGSDQKTLTGSEVDLARLVAAVLGLEPEVKRFTWENLFVGIDSGKVDVGFSNITDTEERKRKYDFASYRKDDLAFETLKSSKFVFDGDYKTLAGATVSVDAGTNQERVLLEWKKKLESEGKKLIIKYFQDSNSRYLALSSGKIDAYLGPSPNLAYHVTQTASTPNATRTAGQYSGAGESLQGLIAATTMKDSGLAKPLADAINHLIENGQYAQWLSAWNLSSDAVTKSEVNPPGLPLDNS